MKFSQIFENFPHSFVHWHMITALRKLGENYFWVSHRRLRKKTGKRPVISGHVSHFLSQFITFPITRLSFWGKSAPVDRNFDFSSFSLVINRYLHRNFAEATIKPYRIDTISKKYLKIWREHHVFQTLKRNCFETVWKWNFSFNKTFGRLKWNRRPKQIKPCPPQTQRHYLFMPVLVMLFSLCLFFFHF